jgi:hypothetical protein
LVEINKIQLQEQYFAFKHGEEEDKAEHQQDIKIRLLLKYFD